MLFKLISTVTIELILSDILADIEINRPNKQNKYVFPSNKFSILPLTVKVINRVSSSRGKFVYFGLNPFELTPLRDPFHALKKFFSADRQG